MARHCFDPVQPTAQYSLPGPQVQPDAGFWHLPPCPRLCIVLPTEVAAPPQYTGFNLADELDELHELAQLRDDRDAVANWNPPERRRLDISPLLQLRPPPLGAQFDRRHPDPHPRDRIQSERNPIYPPGPAVIRTGRQLARFFENEPPGQPLRHALDALVTAPQPGTGVPYFTWSPPLIALAFAALDIAIYSAQITAWFYKFNGGAGIEFRPRPIEVDPTISVLFDRQLNETQSGDGPPRPLPVPSPGTPRHPSYPSGHSVTYGAAAQLLSAFFPDLRAEFNKVADNAGLARLWAGIHYRSDHLEGMALGRRVADRVIEQIRDSCICLPDPCLTPDPCQPPATPESTDHEKGRLCRCCCKKRRPKDPERRKLCRECRRHGASDAEEQDVDIDEETTAHAEPAGGDETTDEEETSANAESAESDETK
jgi:PAP2 superfamily